MRRMITLHTLQKLTCKGFATLHLHTCKELCDLHTHTAKGLCTLHLRTPTAKHMHTAPIYLHPTRIPMHPHEYKFPGGIWG